MKEALLQRLLQQIRNEANSERERRRENGLVDSGEGRHRVCDGNVEIQEALGMSVFQVMAFLGLGFPEARQVLEAAAAKVPDATIKTACEVYKERKDALTSPLSIIRLYGGHLVEIVARAGLGKTQFCLTTAVEVTARTGMGVVYIDTENKFDGNRVLEILEKRLLITDEETRDSLAEKIMVFSPTNTSQLDRVLNSVDTLLSEREIGVVIFDSVAALGRTASKKSQDLIKRQTELSQLAVRLKMLAETYKIPILVTNQVVSSHNSSALSKSHNSLRSSDVFQSLEQHKDSEVKLHAALGSNWAHSVNVRIMFEMERDDAILRRARLVKSPISPDGDCKFRIQASGIAQV